MRMLGLHLTKVGDVEKNPGPITQTNKSVFAISAITKDNQDAGAEGGEINTGNKLWMFS